MVEGERAELVCNVTGVPPPTVTWYRVPGGGAREPPRGERAREGQGEKVLHRTRGFIFFIRLSSLYYCSSITILIMFDCPYPVHSVYLLHQRYEGKQISQVSAQL